MYNYSVCGSMISYPVCCYHWCMSHTASLLSTALKSLCEKTVCIYILLWRLRDIVIITVGVWVVGMGTWMDTWLKHATPGH